MNDFTPDTEPAGAMAPPNRRPPTAVALATPPAPLPSRRRVAVGRRSLLDFARGAALLVLDVADDLADFLISHH